MVNVLDIKVLRDLWAMRLQVLSIGLLVAAGVAVFVMSVTDYRALVAAMDSHYRNERFADLFVHLSRAPLTIAGRLREIDGISVVEPRIVSPVSVIRDDTTLPISGLVVSVPAVGQPLLNRLHLVDGRWVDPSRPEEVMVGAAYAEARKVEIGDSVDIVLNGRLQKFSVVGIALSPEFVFATRAALPLPDDRNFVVLWAGRDAIAAAFDMQGAFNDAVMTLGPGASARRVMEEVDAVLTPYGGTGSFERIELASHRFLMDELAEQRTLSIVMPAVFFGIAAFLLNVVMGRMVDAQRGQIASLKALGFSNGSIGLHYVKIVTAIALLGSAAGVVLGIWLARAVVVLYAGFFRFPSLEARLEPWLVAIAMAASVAAANAGALAAVFRIVRLAPANAMHVEMPAGPRLSRWLMRTTRRDIPLQYVVSLRNLLGRPVRTLLTVAGIALSVPLILFGLYWFDAVNYMSEVMFERIERGDAFLVFSGPVSTAVRNELLSVPGVVQAELQRTVPVKLHVGHRSYRTAIVGLDPDSELKVLRDTRLRPVEVPLNGLVVSRPIATRLGIREGDTVTVEALADRRTVGGMTVSRISDDIIGFSASMNIAALNRFMREGPVANGAVLRLDPHHAGNVWSDIRSMPKVEGSSAKALWVSLFDQTIAGMLVVSAVILAGFGMLIALGVVYNSARITLQERAWELASLRILGFTKREVASVLAGELAVMVMIAVPLGLLLGGGLIRLIVTASSNESFQIPFVIDTASYVYASLLVVGAALISGIAIRDRVEMLDLVAVLKTRD